MKPLSIPSSKYSMDTFSAVGLHVLVVDDDPVCLMVLETMLKKCNYKVTTCNRANHALDLLRDNQEDFDIVLSDAYMPDVDGFKLLEIIGLKLDLPVIIMSANGDTSAVMKGITHGACDYLIKPVRMEELRNIWQHVIRRKGTDSPSMGTHSEWNDSTRAGELPEHSSKKRKEANALVQDFVDDTSSLKKARVNWSVHLHQQFVNAVNQLGVEKAVPKKLLDIMNVQGLTRENVASHLQKYRLYLKRLSGVVPEPCPIASFQASEDGISGGTMHVLPGRKISTLPSVVKGLNLGAGLAGSSTGGQTIDAGIKKSLAQLNVSQKQKQGSANRAQVLGGLGLVDSHLLSTSHGGDLYRKSSLDLSFYPEEQKNDSPAWKLLPNPLGDLAASGFKGVNLEDEIGLRSHSSQIGGSTRQWKINLGGIHDVRPDAAVDLRMQGNQLNYSPEKMEVTCHEGKQAARHIEIPDDLSSTNLSRELSSCTPTEMTREGFSGPNNSLEGLSILMLDNFLQSPDQLNISDYLLDEAFPFDK